MDATSGSGVCRISVGKFEKSSPEVVPLCATEHGFHKVMQKQQNSRVKGSAAACYTVSVCTDFTPTTRVDIVVPQ